MTLVTDSNSYDEMQRCYSEFFSLGNITTDINTKFALISLICYLVKKLREKKPDVTFYQIVYKLGNELINEKYIKRLAIICEDFSYGCKEFPTFGIEDKKIPSKVKEILHNWLPF